MPTRKIVKSGNTSYVLALPIDWIRKNNIEINRVVHISENESGDLIIGAEEKTAPKQDFVTIKTDGKDIEEINLELFSAYVRDAASIIFEGNEIVKKVDKILEQVKFYIGLDVIEQSTMSITAKNFFTLDKETSPHILLKKMTIVNLAAFDLLQVFFSKGFAQEDFYELQKLKEQNERLFMLTQKSVLKLLEHPKLMRNIQTNHIQISKDRIYLQSFRNISLSLLSLGHAFLFLSHTQEEVKKLQKYFQSTHKDYRRLLNAIQNKAQEKIHAFLRTSTIRKGNIETLCKSLEDTLLIEAGSAIALLNRDLHDMAYESLL